ncbi:type II secretion system protein [Candidatus Saccharibacteria bacterium]|nr:type II secretion system protein [Candidatus Saccharibacteria bacterium]
MWAKHKKHGFTIVELLIVIVVIGILAAITIVAYNGIQNRAKASSVQAAAVQAGNKVMIYAVQNSDQYPTALVDAGVNDSNNISYQYTRDNSTSPRIFCVTATIETISYYISSAGGVMKQGICPGHNLLVWNKTQVGAAAPVTGATIDALVYRTSTASMRFGPGLVGAPLLGNPYSGIAGQVYTVNLWIQTDSTWNGTGGNSKIRFGDINGALLSVCGYNGVKLSWTFITCSYTLTPSVTQVRITVGNDGTVGNIWIDDFSLTLSE